MSKAAALHPYVSIKTLEIGGHTNAPRLSAACWTPLANALLLEKYCWRIIVTERNANDAANAGM